jgi:hypothetical protein
VPSSLRFSNVSPRDVAEVKRLRDIHRGVTPAPPHQGEVPPGPEDKAVLALVKKAQPVYGLLRRLWEPLERSYVRAHVRTLPNGRQVHVPAYFTKVVPKGKQDTPRKPPALKQEPPPGVHTPQTPEQLAHRLVRHVKEGTLTHEEAMANILHLEERAIKGHGLVHGHGPAWTPDHVKEFAAWARDKLREHVTEQKRQQQAKAEQERQKEEARQKRTQQRREQRARQKEARGKEQGDGEPAHREPDHEPADTRQRHPVEQRLNEEHFSKAPRLIRDAIRRGRQLADVIVNDSKYRSSCYSQTRRAIVMHDRQTQDRFGPVWRHEYGHHIDFEMNPGRLTHPGSMAARDGMADDSKVLTKGTEAQRREVLERRHDTVAEELMRHREAGLHFEAAVTKAWEARGVTEEDLHELYGERWDHTAPKTHEFQLAAWDTGDAAFYLNSLPHANPDLWHVQDAIGAITKNKLKLSAGHSTAYYNKANRFLSVAEGQQRPRPHNYMHATEAYANWFASVAHGSPVYPKLYAHFAPRTFAAFQRITEEWSTTIPTAAA